MKYAEIIIAITIFWALVLTTTCAVRAQSLHTYAGTSTNHQKYVAMALTEPIAGGPFFVGGRVGGLNWTNVRDFEAWSPLAQADVGLRLQLGPVYLSASQGIAAVAPAVVPYMGLKSVVQLPTQLEIGACQGSVCLGAYGIHYSNGRTNQGTQVYNGFGLAITRKLR